jgi:hypothetical protein
VEYWIGIGAVGNELGCGMGGVGWGPCDLVVVVVVELLVITIEHDMPQARWYDMMIGIGERLGCR